MSAAAAGRLDDAVSSLNGLLGEMQLAGGNGPGSGAPDRPLARP